MVSRISPTNNEMKDIMKVIKSKKTNSKILVAKSVDFSIFQNINVSWFIINEKSPHTIS